MITSRVLNNNVRTTLSDPITALDTSVTLNKTSPPYKDPPAPNNESLDQSSIITLVDSLTTPTKIEIVSYTGLTDNGDGTITLTGLTRGAENTIASAFSSGHYAYQSLTAASLSSPLLALDHGEGIVTVRGNAPDVAGLVTRDCNGVRVVYGGGIQNGIEIALDEHGFGARTLAMVSLGDDAGFIFPPSSSPTDEVFPLLFTNNTGYADNKPAVRMKYTEIERTELHKTTRWWPADQGSMTANTTIDWKDHDIIPMALASNSAVTMQDTSDYLTPGGAYRRSVLLVSTASVNPGYTVTWSANVKHAGGVAPTFTGTNRIFKIEVLYNGTYFLLSVPEVFQL